MKTLSLIGAGKMGQAMLKGWLNSGLPYPISVFDPNFICDFDDLIHENGVLLNPKNPAKANIVILGIKPQTFANIVDDIEKYCDEDTLCISIMAGVSISSLSKTKAKRIMRVMPNTPGQIGQGICGIFGNEFCSPQDWEIAKSLLSPLGAIIKVETEGEIDAVTAVSGSGPAYVFLMAEAMADAGVKLGLDYATSLELAIATIKGAGALMMEGKDTPENLRNAVTSPGGTTKAALDVLMNDDKFQSLMSDAISAAFKRAKELSN